MSELDRARSMLEMAEKDLKALKGMGDLERKRRNAPFLVLISLRPNPGISEHADHIRNVFQSIQDRSFRQDAVRVPGFGRRCGNESFG